VHDTFYLFSTEIRRLVLLSDAAIFVVCKDVIAPGLERLVLTRARDARTWNLAYRRSGDGRRYCFSRLCGVSLLS
jgi:hypothetical protein